MAASACKSKMWKPPTSWSMGLDPKTEDIKKLESGLRPVIVLTKVSLTHKDVLPSTMKGGEN